MEAREQRGLLIAATSKITRKGSVWLVPSSENASRKYTVHPDAEQPHCTCPDHETRGCDCKHIYAVRFVIQRELFDDGTEVETREITVTETRKTYQQNWPAYNRAQQSEKATLQVLLRALCQAIPDATETRRGRPRLPIRDGIFCACFKVYSQLSSRRFTSDLEDAHAKGHISRVPHFNSVLNIFDADGTTDILTDLIERSAAPLAAIETSFAIDSSGFSGCRFDRWYDAKWKGVAPKTSRTWVKAHAMCGVATNVVTAVQVLGRESNDCPLLQPLLQSTAKRFEVKELSADKAYVSGANFQAIEQVGARAFIPFKRNSVARESGAWNRAYHFFHLHRDEFLARYHQRSNVESTFSMIKRKFGDSVKAKNDRAMRNEVLAKFVCHNLCCLILAMQEFGIDPTFGQNKPCGGGLGIA